MICTISRGGAIGTTSGRCSRESRAGAPAPGAEPPADTLPLLVAGASRNKRGDRRGRDRLRAAARRSRAACRVRTGHGSDFDRRAGVCDTRNVNRSGAREQRPDGEQRDATLGEQPPKACRRRAATTGGEFAKAFGREAALFDPAAQPGEQRGRGQRGDGGPQRRAGAIEQAPDGAVGDAEVDGDLLVAVSADGRADDHLTLQLRQRGDLGERLAQDEPALDVGLAGAGAQRRIGDRLAVVRGVADGVDGGVVDDAVQPGFEIPHLRALAQRHPGLQQGLLKDVLRARLGQREAPAVVQQRPPVPVHERLERTLMTLADKR